MIVLADTSVWIGHFRKNDPPFAELLTQGSVLMHPFVLGEIACGKLRNRATIIASLKSLPGAISASNEEVLRLVETRDLAGRGIGWVDAHLIASALLTHCLLWTFDVRLHRTAAGIGLQCL